MANPQLILRFLPAAGLRQLIRKIVDTAIWDAWLTIVLKRIEDKSHPATRALPNTWIRTDEWYSFAESARKDGVQVLATLDESTYKPVGLRGQDLKMRADHPVIRAHCQGKGRVLYSGLGHRAEAYAEPLQQELLRGAKLWAGRLDGSGCDEQLDQGANLKTTAGTAEEGQ